LFSPPAAETRRIQPAGVHRFRQLQLGFIVPALVDVREKGPQARTLVDALHQLPSGQAQAGGGDGKLALGLDDRFANFGLWYFSPHTLI
jgi:hypothetical protein